MVSLTTSSDNASIQHSFEGLEKNPIDIIIGQGIEQGFPEEDLVRLAFRGASQVTFSALVIHFLFVGKPALVERVLPSSSLSLETLRELHATRWFNDCNLKPLLALATLQKRDIPQCDLDNLANKANMKVFDKDDVESLKAFYRMRPAVDVMVRSIRIIWKIEGIKGVKSLLPPARDKGVRAYYEELIKGLEVEHDFGIIITIIEQCKVSPHIVDYVLSFVAVSRNKSYFDQSIHLLKKYKAFKREISQVTRKAFIIGSLECLSVASVTDFRKYYGRPPGSIERLIMIEAYIKHPGEVSRLISTKPFGKDFTFTEYWKLFKSLIGSRRFDEADMIVELLHPECQKMADQQLIAQAGYLIASRAARRRGVKLSDDQLEAMAKRIASFQQ